MIGDDELAARTKRAFAVVPNVHSQSKDHVHVISLPILLVRAYRSGGRVLSDHPSGVHML